MKRALVSLMMVGLLGACERTAPVSAGVMLDPRLAPRDGSNIADTTVRAQPPLRVSWEQVSLDAHHAVVLAKVERILPMDLPFAVSLELPAGVSLKSGRQSFSLMPNVEGGVASERYELVFESAPTDVALLKVDGETGVMGYHFRVPYRFGRAEPVVAAPEANGPHLVKGGVDFGPSIPLK